MLRKCHENYDYKLKRHGYIDLSWSKYHQDELNRIKITNPELYEKYKANIHGINTI